jgi:hypothetical protein
VLTPTVAVDVARRAPLAPPRAHNGWFKDKDGALVPCLILRSGAAPDVARTKGCGAKKHSCGPLRPKRIAIWPDNDFDSRSKTPLMVDAQASGRHEHPSPQPSPDHC